MALRTIRTEEDPVLRKKSRIVDKFDDRNNTLINDLRDTLINSGGVGLAAPQVGVLRRVVVVMDTNKKDLTPEEQIIELVNPEIVKTEGKQKGPEGCLSIPGICGIVERPEKVTVRALDRKGNEFEVEGTGLTARAFCHEIAHLDGQLYVDIAERMMTEEELDEYYENGGDKK